MDNCPFCDLAAGRTDTDLVIMRTPSVFVVPALKQRQLNRGHMLVAPAAHVTRLIEAEASLLQELYSVAGRVGMAIRNAFGATGVTLFQNDDAPDQELSHLHVHVVPRRSGDDFRLPDPNIEVVHHEERHRQALELRRALG